MHCLAANPNLQTFETFTSNERNGFGGRRAFSSEKELDLFHSTVQGIVSKSLAIAKEHDGSRKPHKMPTICRVVFPIVVLDGELFDAHLDAGQEKLQLCPADSVRLHWRGAGILGSWISTVDIVRAEALSGFISRRKPEWDRLLQEAQRVLPKIARCYEERSLASLDIRRAPRGYVGLPPLLRDLHKLKERNPGTDEAK
jgi:hypothetical protein